jgi:hypothetical protein
MVIVYLEKVIGKSTYIIAGVGCWVTGCAGELQAEKRAGGGLCYAPLLCGD